MESQYWEELAAEFEAAAKELRSGEVRSANEVQDRLNGAADVFDRMAQKVRNLEADLTN